MWNELNLIINNSLFYLKPWSIVIGILWCINIFNWIIGSPLNRFGIYPRKLSGLIGIIFSPILHQDFKHLLFNSIPLFVLGLVLLVREGTLNFYWITLVIVVVSGLCVWLLGRKGIHIGASSLISGYFGFILITAYTKPSIITIIPAFAALYYFGGILAGLVPSEKKTSFEGHIFGFLSGILCAYIPNELLLFIHTTS